MSKKLEVKFKSYLPGFGFILKSLGGEKAEHFHVLKDKWGV